jgi:hypothetical protein
MNAAFRIYLVAIVTAVVAFAHAEDVASDKRWLAGWKIVQPDGLGDVYYLYPDGLFVRQGVRRREFVTIGRWRIEEKKHLVLFDLELRNTTLSAEALASIKAKKEVFDFIFDSDEKMRWVSVADNRELKRIRDLPERTENIYWGLGTDEDYERAIRRERGLPPKQRKEPNKAPEPTPTSVTPPATQEARRP